MTALKKIRIGTDVITALSVNISGKPVTWSEGDIRHVYAFSDIQGQPVAEMAHKAEGQTLRCTYAAKDQNYTGPFRVIVEFADGKAFSSSLDVPAFEIVRTTEEADADTGEVVLDIDGTMRFYSLSEAIAKIEGATKAATDAAAAADRSAGNADAKATAANEAAVKANAAAQKAETTNTSIAEAEEQRVNAENARKEAELARADAEKARASAEGKRADAEAKRAEAEVQRAAGEQSRVNAETGRVNAEAERVKAESARADAEVTRAANEEQRKKNESARTSAEAGRVETEKGRVAAESARVAEFSRLKTESETATDNATKAAAKANTAAIAAEKAASIYQSEIDDINNGYRVPTDADFTQSIDGHFKIENGSLYGKRGGAEPAVMMVFNEGIKAIEFEIASLWDSNFISLVFGLGVDTGNNKPCFARTYLNTSARPNEVGFVLNEDYDGEASADQPSSVWGEGHFSGDYRQPQVKPYAVAIGDKCRIELIDDHYFKASVYNPTSGCWAFWWCLDTDGTWHNPKMGWTTRKAIGFEIIFAAITTWKELVKNIRIISEDGKTSGIYSKLKYDSPERKQWVAIGDSITEIDKNNGLSYVGYAQRKLGFKVDNQGNGGWTIYKLWRDRATAGWESAVSAINDGDLVTILAGTNDFDTDSFATLSSDEAMDAAGNPHPRFGTTDPTSEDAKDPHTTLGCLRLMIERILELKPGARLSVFSPFYREKGAPIGQTSWNKLYINSDGKTIYDYADAIYSVAREYNLPAYNTCRDCGINALTITTYTYDDLHIGQLGGELVGDYVAKRIL